MITFTFDLPLPPQELKPNSRSHWAKKAKKTQEYRGETFLLANNLLIKSGLRGKPLISKATVQVDYYHKTKSLQDPDNIVASLKAAIDGLTSAGVLADDRDLIWLPVRRLVAREHDRKPGVVIVIAQVNSMSDILERTETQTS